MYCINYGDFCNNHLKVVIMNCQIMKSIKAFFSSHIARYV